MTEQQEPLSCELLRYARQVRYAPLGEQGQRHLLSSRVLICGCGALGSVLANTLARAGVGHLRIVDRDFLELNNLQRQVLFDEEDLSAALPKAIAAANKLRKINSDIEIEPIVADVDHTNIFQLCKDVNVIVDGTDNFETRFLLNDVAMKLQIPWVYGGCLGAEGQTMTIIPGKTACLRCLMRDTPPPGTTPTCDTAGILGGIINVIASIEAVETIKLLSGATEAVSKYLTIIDLWDNQIRQMNTESLHAHADCPTCRGDEFPLLEGKRGNHSAVLCGRNAVQLSPISPEGLDLEQLATKLTSVGEVNRNRYLLRLSVDNYLVTLFPDGRAIIGGTDDPGTARTIYAKYIGN